MLVMLRKTKVRKVLAIFNLIRDLQKKDLIKKEPFLNENLLNFLKIKVFF